MEPAGSAIVEAGNRRQGIEALSARGFCMVQCDRHMPVMSGTDRIAKIRKNAEWADLPIFIVSADNSSMPRPRAEASGATGWFKKPVSRDRLLAAMGRALSGTAA
ncbi:MAG: response regulator [Polyangiaceae bacterium]|nr:response regulator [Polyangiaceae bacterium]